MGNDTVRMRKSQNFKKGVTPAKAGVQKFLKRLDSRFRGNDNCGLLQLARIIIIDFKVSQGRDTTHEI